MAGPTRSLSSGANDSRDFSNDEVVLFGEREQIASVDNSNTRSEEALFQDPRGVDVCYTDYSKWIGTSCNFEAN